MFLDWESVYPLEDVPPGVMVLWASVGTLGLLVGASALSSGIRRD